MGDFMKIKKHGYFKDDIRKMLLLHGIIPVFFVSLVCLLLFAITWGYSMKKTNQENNREISAELEETVRDYMILMEELITEMDLINPELGQGTRVSIFEKIYKLSNERKKKANLYVFDEELNSVISATREVPEFLNGEQYANWGIFRKMNENPGNVEIKVVEETDSDVMWLVMGRTIGSANEKKEGYVVFALDSRQFNIELTRYSSQTVIADQYGWIFAGNSYDFLDSALRFDLTRQTSNDYITGTDILEGNLWVYSISSKRERDGVLGYVAASLGLVFLMITTLVFITTKMMSASKTKDLYTIVEAFEKVKGGNLDTYIEIPGDNEFTLIAEAYNLMLDSLKEQMETNLEMGQLVNSSQTKQLESQFNPHFLFNTLENIRFMCKLDANLAEKMMFQLSVLLRYSISNQQEEVTLEEDIQYTENYMNILKYRFNRRFHYTMDISPEAAGCIIPKLVVQPMIENAIKYGFEGRENLTVTVKAEIVKMEGEESILLLTCQDNGAGMKDEVLREMQQLLKEKTNRSNHFGLFNIHRRIRLRYGAKYGVEIQSKEGEGTVLKILLPVR